MSPTVPTQLTRTARRAQAAAMIREETNLPPVVAMVVADTLDAVSAAVLRTAGLDDDTARVVLAALWQLTPLPAPREHGTDRGDQ